MELLQLSVLHLNVYVLILIIMEDTHGGWDSLQKRC